MKAPRTSQLPNDSYTKDAIWAKMRIIGTRRQSYRYAFVKPSLAALEGFSNDKKFKIFSAFRKVEDWDSTFLVLEREDSTAATLEELKQNAIKSADTTLR